MCLISHIRDYNHISFLNPIEAKIAIKTDVYKNGYADGKESVTGVELQDVEAALKDVKGIGPVVWNRIQERLAELFRKESA